MSEDYTFLRNDQLKIMQDELEKQKAYIDFLQDTINTLDYQLAKYKLAFQMFTYFKCKRACKSYCADGYTSKGWYMTHLRRWWIKKAERRLEEKMQKAREEK